MNKLPTFINHALLSLLCVSGISFAEEVNVKSLLEKLPATADEPVWTTAIQLTKIAEENQDELKLKLEGASPEAVIAISYALMHAGDQRDAALALEKLIRNNDIALSRRIDAAAVFGAEGGSYAKSRLRSLLAEKEIPEILQVELAKSLWKLSYDSAAKDKLVEIMTTQKNNDAGIEAALALGRFGQYDDVREELVAISKTPGEDGDEAKALLKLDEKSKKRVSRDEFAEELIGEVVEKIRSSYAFDDGDPKEAKQIQAKNLATAAAKGMVRSLDDFNDYLDEEDYQEMMNGMRGDYGGVGAYVGMRNGYFTILTPMWGKPAHKAGLKAMDIITEIDGLDITKMELTDIIKHLKGKPGKPVTVKVIREGWDEAKDITVVRDLITLPMVFSQKLPGDIGYIRLTGFQEDPYRRVSTSSEMNKALLQFKKEGVKGIVLDLRNNPGGLLSEAVNVCENFLERNKLVVYSKGKIAKRRNYYSKILGEPTFTGPLVVLINGGSASASEIVSGALRDHKRATIVGEKSFGKGSVQMLIPIDTTDRNTRLKLTIAKYYLPEGECIHGRDKGIKPHITIEEEKLTDIERALRLKQLENRDISVWLDKNYDANKDAFDAVLEFDNNDISKYPKFAELSKMLHEKYPEIKFDDEILRRELRSNLLAFLRESRGIETHPVDLMASKVLQRGIVALGEKMGGLPDKAVYNSFKEDFKDDEVTDKVAIINGKSKTK